MADPPVTTVADQRDKPESSLSLCRRLLALRRTELGHGLADFENLAVTEGVWTYRTGSLMMAANFTDQPADMPAAAGEVLLTTSAEQAPPSPGALRPWEGVVTRRPGSAAGHDQL
jgi:hypothetical protein